MEGSSYAKTSDEVSTLLRYEGESLKLTAVGDKSEFREEIKVKSEEKKYKVAAVDFELY